LKENVSVLVFDCIVRFAEQIVWLGRGKYTDIDLFKREVCAWSRVSDTFVFTFFLLLLLSNSFGAIDSMPVGQQMSPDDFETLLKTLYPMQTTTKQVAIILYNGLTAQDLLYSDKNEEVNCVHFREWRGGGITCQKLT
jgi:hypothetical protein